MKIESPNVSFKSRNPIVRKADNICRKVHRSFPCISPTKLIYKGRTNKSIASLNLGFRLQNTLQEKIRWPMNSVDYKQTSTGYFKCLSNLIRKNKRINMHIIIYLNN